MEFVRAPPGAAILEPDASTESEPIRASVVVEATREEPKPMSRTPEVEFVPTEGADAWRDAVRTLKNEADGASGPGRAALLYAAGRISARRLSDLVDAETSLSGAANAGDASTDLQRLLAEIRGAQNRHNEQEKALLEVARRSSGVDRAEAYLEAALIAWRRRDRPAEAVAYLREAAKAEPSDYTSRALLRALLPAIGGASANERIELLGEVAALAEGGIAADARVEQATLAEEAGRSELARRALEQALEAEPGHTFAFQRLERILAQDPVASAQLYEREAARVGQTDPGWWKVKAARAWHSAGRGEAAVEAFTAAVDAGYGFALRELQGAYLRIGAFRELEGVLAREAAALSPEQGRSHALYRLGWLRETHLSDRDGALRAYREAVSVDPSASPAADAVARLLPAAEQVAFLEERSRTTADPEERRALRLWLAELIETEDPAAARALFEAVVESGPGVEAEVARDGLDRVLQRTGDLLALSRLRRGRAESASDLDERVAWLLMAGSVPADRSIALPLWLSALDARPDHPVALAAVSVALELEENWAELARRFEEAAHAAADPSRKASHLFRTARIHADRGGDPAVAHRCLQLALEIEPRLRPARWLVRAQQPERDPGLEASLYRGQAEHAEDPTGRAWARFAAAVLTGPGGEGRADLDAILSERGDHPGALASLEVVQVAEGDRQGLVSLYRRAIDSASGLAGARLAARSAELLVETGRNDEAALVLRRLRGIEGAPVRAGARLALAIGATDRAIDLLASSDVEEDRIERARLLAGAGRPADALPLLLELIGSASSRVGVASRAATVAQQVGDTPAMIRAYAAISQHARSEPLRAAYGGWTAMQLQGVGRDGEALEHWQIARAFRPGSTLALLGAARGLAQRKDPGRIRALFEEVRPEARTILVDALISAGDREGAAEVLTAHAKALEGSDLPEARFAALIEVERLRAELGHWQASYDALVQRRELCRNPTNRAIADAARRWLLAEKLADSDAAWDLYHRLHQDAPHDRQVTEALARIAGARGEIGVAIGFLTELADSTTDPAEAARYRRRIGAVHEGSGDVDKARQAYLDALDHVRDDPEALQGLRRLAEVNQDWPGLIAVLQREASSADRARQIELRRQIARVTEQRLGDRRVAMDAWRGLLELEPTNREGLEHLLDLAEAAGEWALYVETGESLARQLEGRERSVLLRNIGIACQVRLGRDDANWYYEQAVATQPPDHEAAVRLEALARTRADWAGTVRALRLQAAAEIERPQRVEALQKAARIEVETLHDKDAAAVCFRQILELEPDNEAALRFMSSWLFETRRIEEALPICERLEPRIEADQDLEDFDTRMELSSFYFYFGEILRARGDDERAIPRYERALVLNPTHLPTLEAVGPLYTSVRDWEKAERVYRQLLQLSGGQGDKTRVASTYTALGLVERELGMPEKSYKRFTKALELHPNHVGALKGMALILEDRQDWSNLLNVYNNVICHATVPEDVIDAYMTKGRILDDQMQRQDKAAQHYQRSLDFDPNQPAAQLRLAELAMRRDGYKEAGELADRALQLDADLVQPLRPLLLVVRAAAWQESGKVPEAERCLREARMLDASLVQALGENPLGDLERIRQVVKERLPR